MFMYLSRSVMVPYRCRIVSLPRRHRTCYAAESLVASKTSKSGGAWIHYSEGCLPSGGPPHAGQPVHRT